MSKEDGRKEGKGKKELVIIISWIFSYFIYHFLYYGCRDLEGTIKLKYEVYY